LRRSITERAQWVLKERRDAHCSNPGLPHNVRQDFDWQHYSNNGASVITRSEFQDIINLEGQVRGSTLNTDAAFVKSRGGKDGLHTVQETFRQLGYPIEYRLIREMGWYPACLRVLSLRVIQDVFDLKEDGMKGMGDTAPKFSFIVKVFMKFAGMPEHALTRIPEYWHMHYSIGDMRVDEMNDQAGYLVIQLTDFMLHPILCSYLEGYFRRLLQFSFVTHDVRSKETKCAFNGAPYHEYHIAWK
jgi:hypothetical protein